MSETPALQGEFDPFEQHVVAGSELLRQSRIKDAQAQLLLALELKPNNPKVLALLGPDARRGMTLRILHAGQRCSGARRTTSPRSSCSPSSRG